jgi:hypothetical protein
MSDAPPTTNPVKIPLYVFPLPGGGGFKIGIKVSFDNKTFKMYEFDTGGTGFWAAGNPNWWSNFSPQQPGPKDQQTIKYSSGIQYTANPVVTDIYFENGLAQVSAQVARIFEATKKKDKEFKTDWLNAFNEPDPKPPLYGQFFGDFGMGLAPFVSKTSGDPVFFAVLPQLTQPLCDGFIIDIGPYPKTNTPVNAEPWLQTGFIQIGLAPGDAAQFPNQFKMQPWESLPASNPVFPNSGMPTYAEELVQGSLTLSPPSFCFGDQTGIVLDTGAPSIELHTGTDQITIPTLNPYLKQDLQENTPMTTPANSKSAVKVNTTLLLKSPSQKTASSGSNILMQVTVGGKSGQNLASATTLNLQGSSGYINTGLVPFFDGPVLYDLRNGIIGFRGPRSL